MQVLILDDDPALMARLAQAMMGRGFQTVCVDSLAAAEAVVRMDFVDLMVIGERVQGRLTHPLALLAECRDPAVPAVLLTDRSGPEIEELFDLIPSIASILGRRTLPAMIAQVAVAAVTGRTRPVEAPAPRAPAAIAAPVSPAPAPAAGGWTPVPVIGVKQQKEKNRRLEEITFTLTVAQAIQNCRRNPKD